MTDMTTGDRDDALLEVRGLTIDYKGRRNSTFRAVESVDLDVKRGETLGVVGESGSGKSTIAKAILGLVPVTDGTMHFEGRDITRAGYRERRNLSAHLQAVFQDPFSQLSPTRTIADTLAEPVQIHHHLSRTELAQKVADILDAVDLPASAGDRYPSQFSGGQRQRIAIARALILQPKLVVCDEPTSALDLSVQAQVLNLMADLQERIGVSYVLVSHDLTVVRLAAHRVVVLYRGQVMESGPSQVVCEQPLHPYTQMLLEAVPVPDVTAQRDRRDARKAKAYDARKPKTAGGDSGCPFASRCVYATDICHTVRPEMQRLPSGSTVACHHWREISEQPIAHRATDTSNETMPFIQSGPDPIQVGVRLPESANRVTNSHARTE
jgi:peptide/nickel transport system ATP-binding protein